MRFARAARHLSDGELLRVLDGDGAGEELDRFDAHAATCPRCGAGLRSLGHAARIVHEGLRDLGASPATPEISRDRTRAAAPPRAEPPLWTRGWARAAVVLLVLAGALLAVAPLRARILGWVAERWGELAGARPAPTARPSPARATAPAPSVLWFTPAGGQLRLVLSWRQAAGTLVLARTSGASASLQIVPADPAVVPLASERLLEIHNGPASRSGYIVRVPPATTALVLTIGHEPPRTIAAAALAAGVHVAVGGARGERSRD